MSCRSITGGAHRFDVVAVEANDIDANGVISGLS
jgi:hypothetical protein